MSFKGDIYSFRYVYGDEFRTLWARAALLGLECPEPEEADRMGFSDDTAFLIEEMQQSGSSSVLCKFVYKVGDEVKEVVIGVEVDRIRKMPVHKINEGDLWHRN